MKKYLSIIVAIVLLSSCTDNSNFSIKGTINVNDTTKLYLIHYVDGDKIICDSSNIKDGGFTLKGHVDFAEVYYISVEGKKSNTFVFVEPAEITIEMNIDTTGNIDAVISGSSVQNIYNSYKNQMDSFNEIDRNIYENIYKEAKAKNDKLKLDYADSLFTKNDNAKREFLISYAFNNDSNFVSPYIIYRNSYQFNLSTLDSITSNFNESVYGSIYYNKLTERVKILKRVDINQPIIDFTLNDTTGNPIILSSLKGKYLLMDFWAAWCIPCRRENPNIVSVYNDYKDNGFDIIGISFDNNSEKWKQAIVDDSLAWTQVSDLKGWKCEAGKLYGVRSIPHSILINPDGIIIAKNLRGEDLRNKISELLD